MSFLHHSGCSLAACADPCPTGVTFVLGTLDGDPVKFNLLKDYVCKALYGLSNGCRTPLFNIIHSSHVISRWCDHVVTWRPETAAQAVSWIQGLPCGSGRSPTDALAAALEDAVCQAVYLVVDALPPSVLREIYGFLSRNEAACAISVVYLTEEPRDRLAEGSFQEISVKPLGSSSMIRSSESVSRSHCCVTPPTCTVPTIHPPQPRLSSPSCSVSCTDSSGSCMANTGQATVTGAALCLLTGARVLARRDTDGLYYMGHIAHEVEGSSDHFLVEFEKCRTLKGKAQFRMQETRACDIIHYEDARWRPLVPGDHVLAPVDVSMEQYGPGTVLRGAESRERGLAFDSNGVLVTFWNGKTKQVPAGLAIWIPQDLSDRTTLELHIPLEARRKLMESCPGFPFIGTGYKHPNCQAEEPGRPGSHHCLYCSADPDVCQRCHIPEEMWAALRNSLNHISRMTSAKEIRSKKMDKEKAVKLDNSLKSYYKKEKTKPQRRNVVAKKCHQPMEQEHFASDRDAQHDAVIRTDSSPVMCDIRPIQDGTMASLHKPPISRLGNMTHLQDTLHRIDQAMKEDRKAMESALLERRPRSAPLRLNYETNAQRNQELKEQKEADKAKAWGIQREERLRRRGERFREMEEREVMLQDSRRLRSEQRILLDLERRQNQEGLEAQLAEHRRAAAEERSRRKEEYFDRETRKEEDRLNFLKELRQHRDNVELEKSQKMYAQEEKHKDLAHRQEAARQQQQEADLQEWQRHQQLQAGTKGRVSKRLEKFYQQAEQESHKDQDLHKYLKDHNLQLLRSAMVQ
ncbi:uncharacterized protein [Hyperolius riggenbachi]|uniref:uncharacterized protein isoform X2 n=1 Tax=Hyperolius riggenbachi TaxID=752182 RepID=UPI0035A3AFDC